MDLLVVVNLSARALHELRKRAWQKTFGFPVPRGLAFRQLCEHEQCADPQHLYLIERRPESWNAGEDNPRAKLSIDVATKIRIAYADGVNEEQLAMMFRVNVRTIRRVLRRESWTT